jgi:hypothetical protein
MDGCLAVEQLLQLLPLFGQGQGWSDAHLQGQQCLDTAWAMATLDTHCSVCCVAVAASLAPTT